MAYMSYKKKFQILISIEVISWVVFVYVWKLLKSKKIKQAEHATGSIFRYLVWVEISASWVSIP